MREPDDLHDDLPDDSPDEPADPTPVTPHATPSIDAAGTLSYVGDDGRRYVVAAPPEQPPLA